MIDIKSANHLGMWIGLIYCGISFRITQHCTISFSSAQSNLISCYVSVMIMIGHGDHHLLVQGQGGHKASPIPEETRTCCEHRMTTSDACQLLSTCPPAMSATNLTNTHPPLVNYHDLIWHSVMFLVKIYSSSSLWNHFLALMSTANLKNHTLYKRVHQVFKITHFIT